MTELEKYREEISAIDASMAKLFEERMRLSAAIAAYKEANGLPTFDPQREKENIEKNKQRVSSDIEDLYVEFLQNNMDLSKKYQNRKRQK